MTEPLGTGIEEPSDRNGAFPRLTDEQIAEYVTKLETDIGTTINEAAFAQVTGANSNN